MTAERLRDEIADMAPWMDEVEKRRWAERLAGILPPSCSYDCDECHDPGPCSCDGRRWVDDENWQRRYATQERQRGNGLIPCGFCNEGGWSTELYARPAPFAPPALRT